MKKGILLFILFLHLPALAVEEPTIVIGDYLFMEATIVSCRADRYTVAHDEVDEKGEVTLFRDITLAVEGKSVHHVVAELVDELEKLTGYRSKTIKIVRVPGSNEKEIALRLLAMIHRHIPNCPNIFKYYEDPILPEPLWDYDYLIALNKTHNKSFKLVPPASWLQRTRTAYAPLN